MTGWVYLTEDSYDARLYRFKPTRFGDLSAGQLQAARVSGTGAVSWVDVSSSSPYRGKETTVFSRPEGAWIHQRVVYFATTGDRRVWASTWRRSG